MMSQSKYSLGDTICFSYMSKNRWGTVSRIHMDYDLKGKTRFKYSIKEMSYDIEIEEKNVTGKVSSNVVQLGE